MYNTITMDGFMNAPACPSSHPVRMPQVAYETVWDTRQFNKFWKAGDPQPFTWSFEGTAGGNHADYMFGWKGDSLQRAMDKSECFYDGCGSIKKQAMSKANQCKIPLTVKEEVNGCESTDHRMSERYMLTFVGLQAMPGREVRVQKRFEA